MPVGPWSTNAHNGWNPKPRLNVGAAFSFSVRGHERGVDVDDQRVRGVPVSIAAKAASTSSASRAMVREAVGSQATGPNRVRTLGHDGLSPFGIGADMSDGEWRTVVRQLVAARLLGVEPEHSTLHLTEGSAAVLRGERDVRLRHDPAAATRGARRAAGPKPARAAVDLAPEATDLFERLRAWRAGVAKEAGLPAYVVFHDATLREVAIRRPATLDDLAGVSGVGATKLERYGAGVLAAVAGEPSETA